MSDSNVNKSCGGALLGQGNWNASRLCVGRRSAPLEIPRWLVFGCLVLWQLAGWTSSRCAAIEPPGKGQPAPSFKLLEVGTNQYLSLEELNQSGPMVIVVLRGFPGYQCPLCNQQVGNLINRANALSKATAQVVLVYPGPAEDLEEHARQFMGSRTLPPPLRLVVDPGMEMVSEYGLRWDAKNETAYPATFVLDQNGRVVWSKISDSHGERTTAQEIIDQLQKIR